MSYFIFLTVSYFSYPAPIPAAPTSPHSLLDNFLSLPFGNGFLDARTLNKSKCSETEKSDIFCLFRKCIKLFGIFLDGKGVGRIVDYHNRDVLGGKAD